MKKRNSVKSYGRDMLENVCGDVYDDYRNMLGVWALKLFIYSNRFNKLPTALKIRSNDFLDLTTLHNTITPEILVDQQAMLNMLRERLSEMEKMSFKTDTNLFKNVALLASILKLDEVDQKVFLFVASLTIFPKFRVSVAECDIEIANINDYANIVSNIISVDSTKIVKSLKKNSMLVETGLIQVNSASQELNKRISATENFMNKVICSVIAEILLGDHKNKESIINQFLVRSNPAVLSIDKFPHLKKHSELLSKYLKNAILKSEKGVNIFLYGAPGTGKTEFAKALVASLGIDLYDIRDTDNEGYLLDSSSRLREFSLSQHFLQRKENSMFLFDEVEDVLPFSSSRGIFADTPSDERTSRKSWVNRILESNQVPTFWVSNTSDLDAAFLRRFNYSIEFLTPPKNVRLSIAKQYFDAFNPTDHWLERIVRNEDITPAQLEQASRVALVGGDGDNVLSQEIVDLTIQRSSLLLKQKISSNGQTKHVEYNPKYINADTDVVRLIEVLKSRPQGTFLFSGHTGTGKSELARYLADNIGLPLIARRASDLLSKWVGENEQNLANMFQQAREQESVLILDEVDSFLADRREASKSWEVTMVNEMLTQMESFPGVFIATTNLDENLDPASIRRFSLKVKFDWLKPDQSWAIFQRELDRRGVQEQDIAPWERKVRELSNLAPGDFSVASRQTDMWGTEMTPESLYNSLKKECSVKPNVSKKIGFV